MTTNGLVDYNYDSFCRQLLPFGSMDIYHLVEKATDLDYDMSEVIDILYNQTEEFGINLFDTNKTTDINALFNDYILGQANSDIYEQTDIDLIDNNVYFFCNYLDDPLQYSSEVADELQEKIDKLELTKDDFCKVSLYILKLMGVTVKE